jgi:HNH endonuclease
LLGELSNYKRLTIQQLARLSSPKIRELIESAIRQEELIKQEWNKYRLEFEKERRLFEERERKYRELSNKIGEIKNNPNMQRHGMRKIFSMARNGIYGKYLPGVYEKLSSLERELTSLWRDKFQNDDKYRVVKGKEELFAKEIKVIQDEISKYRRAFDSTVLKEEKSAELKAEIASARGHSRVLGNAIRGKLPTDHPCPYCGGGLGQNYQTDHIYPISKGGRSTIRNMVNACSKCNTIKSHLTVYEFSRNYNLNLMKIIDRLRQLDKEI